jgi:hypothetical protein
MIAMVAVDFEVVGLLLMTKAMVVDSNTVGVLGCWLGDGGGCCGFFTIVVGLLIRQQHISFLVRAPLKSLPHFFKYIDS